MARKQDPAWEIGFFESVLRNDPSYVDVVAILGGLYTKTGRIADGLRMDRKMVRLCPKDATAHYNLACSLALSGRPSHALTTLTEAVKLGYDDSEWMAHDPDLSSLQELPEFNQLLAKIRDA